MRFNFFRDFANHNYDIGNWLFVEHLVYCSWFNTFNALIFVALNKQSLQSFRDGGSSLLYCPCRDARFGIISSMKWLVISSLLKVLSCSFLNFFRFLKSSWSGSARDSDISSAMEVAICSPLLCAPLYSVICFNLPFSKPLARSSRKSSRHFLVIEDCFFFGLNTKNRINKRIMVRMPPNTYIRLFMVQFFLYLYLFLFLWNLYIYFID